MGGYSQETVTDELTWSNLGLKSTYSSFTNKKSKSDAVYCGCAMKGSNGAGCIQLNNKTKATAKQPNKRHGIVTTVSGGKIKSIKVDFVTTTKIQNLTIYGRNSAYSGSDDLTTANEGTKIATISKSQTINVEGNYKYVGIYSNGGVNYISKITIVWEKESSKTPTNTTFGDGVDEHIFTITEGEPFPTHVATMTTAGVAGTIAYASDNAAVKVDQNGVTSAGTGFGKAKITATFKPTDTETYASSSAFYYIDYKEKTKPATAITFEKSNVTLTTLDYASFTGQTATLKAGETTLTNKLTYTKEDAAGVITTLNNNDGTLVLSGNEGTATVTATFAGNDEYASSTASYTITVVDPNKLEVTFDFTKPNLYDYDVPASGSGTSLEEGNIIKSGIVTITNVKSGGTDKYTNKCVFHNTKNEGITLRFYTNAEATVSVPTGYEINKIEFVTDNTSDQITITPELYNSEKSTWTGSANSVSLMFKSTVKFTSMTVYYAKATPEVTYGTINFIAHDAEGYRYATFSSDKNVVFTDDVVVSGVSITNGKLNVTDFTSGNYDVTDAEKGNVKGYYVPANTGVLVNCIAETATYYFPNTTTTQTVTLPANQLKPAPVGGVEFTAETGYKYYKLAYDNYTAQTGLGFYWGEKTGGAFNVKAGTAYLAVPTSESNAKGFAFDGETTGIENVNVAANQSKTIYNLNGQRVSNMSQAGLYIVNGKKVVIRK